MSRIVKVYRALISPIWTEVDTKRAIEQGSVIYSSRYPNPDSSRQAHLSESNYFRLILVGTLICICNPRNSSGARPVRWHICTGRRDGPIRWVVANLC